MRTIQPSEHSSQKALIAWFSWNCKRWNLPEYALMAIPNGGARHIAVASKLKAEGVRKGAPDLFLAMPRDDASGLFLEMKRKPNKPTQEQIDMIAYLRTAGYDVCVCYGFDEAVRAIEGYLGK